MPVAFFWHMGLMEGNMNKKLLSSCLVLSICAIALAPIYKQLDISNNETVHPMTEWYAENPATVSSMQQQLRAVDYTVTYPQAEEKVIVLTANTKTPPSSSETVAKKSTAAASATKVVTKATTKTASSKTTAKAKASTFTRKKSTPPTRVSRGTSTASSSKANAVISTAKSLIGVPYVWGGQAPSGFDCSGFTQYVLKKHGISVPRTAAEQYTTGTSVSKSNLRVGDLVFFTTYKAGASHLGFYLGNGNFIHASSSKGVTISSLSSSYYSSHYIGARRVIK